MRLCIVVLMILLCPVLNAACGFGDSSPFILDYAGAFFSWITPSGCEAWLYNQNVTLNWNTTESNPGNIDLLWSSNGGMSWSYIVQDIADTGTYQWTVPDVNAEEAVLCVEMTDSYGNTNLCYSPYFVILASHPFSDSPVFAIDLEPPVVEIIYPLGDEEVVYNTVMEIEWNASDNHFISEPISISWSDDNGDSWELIETGIANALLYSWLVPHQETEAAEIRIRAIDSFGNQSEDISGCFAIVGGSIACPQNVTCTAVNSDIVLSWDPVTQMESGDPVTVDGYFVMMSNEVTDEFVFLDFTTSTTYTHHNVAGNQDCKFYHIVAYIEDTPLIGGVHSWKDTDAKKNTIESFRKQVTRKKGQGAKE